MMDDWQCSCEACMGTLSPPEPDPDEFEAWLMQQQDPPLALSYLGVTVTVTTDANEKGNAPRPGWVNARWPDGKVWTHWHAQLLAMP